MGSGKEISDIEFRKQRKHTHWDLRRTALKTGGNQFVRRGCLIGSFRDTLSALFQWLRQFAFIEQQVKQRATYIVHIEKTSEFFVLYVE